MNYKKPLGIVFLAAGIVGLVICITGIAQVWRLRGTVLKVANETLDTMLATVETTEDALVVIEDLVTTTSTDVALIESTVQTVTLTLDDTNRILGSLTVLTGTDLPATIEATKASLESAQASAQLIDDVLGAITSVPFFGLAKYQPEIPLNVALGDISESLEPLKPSFATITSSLESASSNLDALEADLEMVSKTTGEIGLVLSDARAVIGDYQVITGDLAKRVARMQQVAAANVTAGAWILTIMLLIFLFPQFGLVERGLSLLSESRENTPTDPDIFDFSAEEQDTPASH